MRPGQLVHREYVLTGHLAVEDRRSLTDIGSMAPLIGVTTSEVRRGELATLRRHGEPPQHEMALGLTYMRAIELAGGVPVVLPPLHNGFDDAARPPRRHLPVRRPRPRPRRLRRPRARAARPDRAAARPLRARARARRRLRGAAAARHLPRRAGAQRRARRHAAPARRGPPPDRARHPARARRADRPALARVARARDPRDAGQLLPPPGGRRARRGPRRHRVGAGRHGRGDRGPPPSVPARRAVARRDAGRAPVAAGAVPRAGRGRQRPRRCSVRWLRERRSAEHPWRGQALRRDHRGRPSRPRGAGGHVRRAARAQRRGQVDHDAAADRAGDRRRGRDPGARPLAAGRLEGGARRDGRRAAARQPRHHADGRAEPARVRAPLPDPARASGRPRSSGRSRCRGSWIAATRAPTSSPAACAGGC